MDAITPISDLGLQTVNADAVNPPSAVRDSPASPVNSPEEQKKQIARDFESVLLTKVFDQVKDSIGQLTFGGEEGDGAGEQIQGIFWLYLAQDVADKGGVGLWKQIYQQFGTMDKASAASMLIDSEL